MRKLLLAAAAVAFLLTGSAMADPSATDYFPGGYQASVGQSAQSWFLSHQVRLTWDSSLGAYTIDNARVVYDRNTKLFYLYFTDTSGEGVSYGPLYSAGQSRQAVTDYHPWGNQSPAVRNGQARYSGVNSFFLSHSVTLSWDSSIGAYTMDGARVEYDRGSRHFYVHFGDTWYGPLPG